MERVSRRNFLTGAALSGAGLLLVACGGNPRPRETRSRLPYDPGDEKDKDVDEEFTDEKGYHHKIKVGEINFEMILPQGKEASHSGTAGLRIPSNHFLDNGYIYIPIIKAPSFLMQLSLNKINLSSLGVGSRLGRADDRDPRDTIDGIMTGIDFSKEINVNIGWSDWKYGEIQINGGPLNINPQTKPSKSV